VSLYVTFCGTLWVKLTFSTCTHLTPYHISRGVRALSPRLTDKCTHSPSSLLTHHPPFPETSTSPPDKTKKCH
jgi:hypothetical protein